MAPSIALEKLVSVDGGVTFVPAAVPPGPHLLSPTNPIFRYVVTNNGLVPLSQITVTDSVLGNVPFVTSLAPDESFAADLTGVFATGLHTNVGTVTAVGDGQTVTAFSTANFTGVVSPVPVFPPIGNPAPQNQIVDRLLETIALEELSLAGLVNAEAEKVQAVSAAGFVGPVDAEDVAAINASVAAVISQAAAKEANLRRKLSVILAHKATFPEQCPVVCPPPPPAP